MIRELEGLPPIERCRKEAFSLVEEEMDYQHVRLASLPGEWNDALWAPNDWLSMIRKYLAEADNTIFVAHDQEQVDFLIMAAIRKIAALGMSALANNLNSVNTRGEDEDAKRGKDDTIH